VAVANSGWLAVSNVRLELLGLFFTPNNFHSTALLAIPATIQIV
jgi:hypothetical protein